MAKTYVIATERNGVIVALKVAPMSIRQAEEHAKRLRALMPSVPVYVLNTESV